ncbi:hypothetical protein QJQ45_006770 [Haematococcus lacustris]|nr:hypothetical protein QJQ45_006770 [Haematococcus lacustris]
MLAKLYLQTASPPGPVGPAFAAAAAHVCSQAATQPAASEPGPSTPPPAKRTKAEQADKPTQPIKGKGKGKAAEAKPAPQPGRWVDRDCNAALNMQRIGESRWRPLELCWFTEQVALPAMGKEYPGLGYKRPRESELMLGRELHQRQHQDKLEPEPGRRMWEGSDRARSQGIGQSSHTPAAQRRYSARMWAQRSKRTKAEPAAEPTKGKGKAQGKAAKAKAAPQPSRWVGVGLELCQWDDLEALPPIGKEYQQRYKLVNDRLPKVKQRLHRAAEYRRGIDGRARNNA